MHDATIWKPYKISWQVKYGVTSRELNEIFLFCFGFGVDERVTSILDLHKSDFMEFVTEVEKAIKRTKPKLHQLAELKELREADSLLERSTLSDDTRVYNLLIKHEGKWTQGT